MYAQNRRNVRSPGGVYAQTAAVRSVPISEECTLKTGGTSAHLQECTLKPPTEVCRFRRNVRSKPEERPLTCRSVRSNRRLRSAPISEECTLKTGGTSAHLEECTLKPPPEKCADFGGMSVRSNRRLRSAPISEECTLKTGGTSAHLEECTLKPPPEKCADFGGIAPISEECTLKTGGTSAHLEECTLKPPTEVCRFRRNVRSKPEERPLTCRSVRSNRRLRSAPISEECTLKTGGTSAHLEECTLKPPPEECADFGGMYAQNRRNVRSPGGVYAGSNRRREKCADFGGMSVRSNRRLRSAPISEECTLKTGGTSAHLQECTLKPPPEKCADFGGMYAQNRRNVRSPGGVSAPISEECTLKTGGTSAHLEECTLKPPTEVCRFRRNVRSKPEERPLTCRSVRSNRRLRSAPISEECTLKTGGTSAHLEECTPAQTAAVRSVPISEECTLKTGGTSAHLQECTLKPPTEVCRFRRRNVRSKPEERPLTWRSVRSNRRLRSAPISEECTLKTGGTSAHLEECTLKPPTEVCRFRRNVRSKPEERPLTCRSVRSNRRLRSAPISEECTLKTGGTSAHLDECTLKPPTEMCADFGGMYAQNRRNVRSPGGLYAQTAAVRSVPISEECTLKTGGTSAHLEDCTLKPSPNVRSKPEERPLTWRSVRSNRRLKCADFGGMYAQNRRNVRSPGGMYAQTAAVRSVPISEECTLKTGGTSAHLEECTLKPPTEECADFGGMYAQNRRNVRSPAGVNVRSKPEERPLTWRSVRSNRRLKCADFGGMYAQNRRNVRSPGGVYAQTAAVRSVPISEECTLKPEERPLTWMSVRSNRRLRSVPISGPASRPRQQSNGLRHAAPYNTLAGQIAASRPSTNRPSPRAWPWY
ncbi:hypothetical protein Bbelb_297690 [Branchiostoma belcheri]|nr:hypothetical protein Bbelb_297690 [Branchiostoma belcheri]